MTFSVGLVDDELAAVRGLSGREVGALSPAELHQAAESLGRARRALDALVVTVAGEVGRRSAPDLGVGGLARREGFSTPQEFLAKTLGTSTFDAKRLLDVGDAVDPSAGRRPVDAPAGPAGGLDVAAPGEPRDERGLGPAPKYGYLATAVASAQLGVEAAALVARTLGVLAPVVQANAAGDEAAAKTELVGLERRLVDKASVLPLRELRRVCERERAWRSPRDVVVRERRQREGRTLFFGEDSEGMTVMTAKFDALSAAPVKAWIEAQTRHAFQLRRRHRGADGNDVVSEPREGEEDNGADQGAVSGSGSGSGSGAVMSAAQRCHANAEHLNAEQLNDDRTAGQIRVDALVSLARHGLDCGSPTSGVKTTVVLRIDVKDLGNESALGECDQFGGPISVGTLRAMAVDAEVIPVTMGGQSLPLDVGRADRYFTRAQRIALVERDGGCSWCHAPPSFCEAHHIDWWAKHRGRTDIANGVLLCVACHHRIHRDGWGMEVRDDEVWFQPAPIDGRTPLPRVGGRAHLTLESQR
jgi:hypothetical protein